MADLIGNRFLDNAAIGAIVETLLSQIAKKRPLKALDRTPVSNAYDDELWGRWTANVYAADIIADDQKAVVVKAGQLELLTTQIPNIKLGAKIDQGQLNRMASYQERGASKIEENAMWDYWNNTINNLLLGVRERLNALIYAAMLDSVIYDRLGIKISGTFNTPAALKVTPSNLWTDATNGKPITDILNLANSAMLTYGKAYDRVTMRRSDFQNMVATAEFQARVQQFFGFAITAAAVNVVDWPTMEGYIGRLLNMTVEIDEATYREQMNDGRSVTKAALPAGKVILSAKADDNDRSVFDLANGMVTEAMVAKMTGMGPTGLAGDRFGPIAWWSPTDLALNPPGVTAWSVQRAYPRKKQPEAQAILTVA